MGEDKELVLHLDRGEHAQLAAASAGVGVLDYVRDAIFMAVQEDQAVGVLAGGAGEIRGGLRSRPGR